MNAASELLEVRQACVEFARVAAPYFYLEDEGHYERALALMESLLDESEDREDDPLNPVISVLSEAIEKYEAQDPQFDVFDREVERSGGAGVVRLLMDQHRLGMKDLPEIGSKSMVSRVLSGQRELSKKHILALSERFGLEPGIFL